MVRNARWLGILAFLFAPTGTSAAVITMEGIAGNGQITTEDNVVRLVDGFNLTIAHGHFTDVNYVDSRFPANGSDFLILDNFGTGTGVVSIAAATSLPFSLQSFSATEWDDGFAGGQLITVTGQLAGGGVIVANFNTAARASGANQAFQTFNLGAGWTNLSSVSFNGGGFMAIDNINVNSAVTPTAIPEPATLAVFGGLALAGLAGYRRRKAKAVA